MKARELMIEIYSILSYPRNRSHHQLIASCNQKHNVVKLEYWTGATWFTSLENLSIVILRWFWASFLAPHFKIKTSPAQNIWEPSRDPYIFPPDMWESSSKSGLEEKMWATKRKKTALLSIESWLFNRDPYVNRFIIIPIWLGSIIPYMP